MEAAYYWIGLDGPGIIEWNRNTGEIILFDQGNPFSEDAEIDITTGSGQIIKKDLSGDIWVGYSGQGLGRVNRQTKQVVRYFSDSGNPGSLSGNYVTGLLVDDANTVWISTTNGLNRYNRAENTFTAWTTQNSELGSNSLSMQFLKTADGIIWIGTKEHVYDPRPTRSEGLIRFDPESESFTTLQA